jgi:hypothetical protein
MLYLPGSLEPQLRLSVALVKWHKLFQRCGSILWSIEEALDAK